MHEERASAGFPAVVLQNRGIEARRIDGLDSQGLPEVTSRELAAASEAGRRLLSTYINPLGRRAARA